MEKLHLTVDELAVQSFSTTELRDDESGTVHGHEDTLSYYTCNGDGSCVCLSAFCGVEGPPSGGYCDSFYVSGCR